MTGITDYVQHTVGWNQITEQMSTLKYGKQFHKNLTYTYPKSLSLRKPQ